MHKKKIIMIGTSIVALVLLAVIITFILLHGKIGKTSTTPNEGNCSILNSQVWHSNSDDKEHQVDYYSLGNTAKSVSSELPTDVVLEHKFIDGIPVYEMRLNSLNDGKIIFFLHGQASRKEEYLTEMINYIDSGYICVCIDSLGHGERISKESLMSYEIIEKTSKDIDVLLNYYDTLTYANSSEFALVGFSQGGSVAYYYSAYGNRIPKAIVVGSSTPDYKYLLDNSSITNGNVTASIWNDTQIEEYVQRNNPINEIQKYYTLPILSGNGLDDTVVSYKGAENLEKILKENGNADINFFYYSGYKHDVPDSFAQKSIKFIQKYL